MNFLKRSVLYLTRKKGRTALMIALLFLMSCLAFLGISFKESAEGQADALRKSLATGFMLEADTENELYHKRIEYENGGGSIIYNGPNVTDEMIEKILSIDGIKDYFIHMSDLAWADLKLRPGAWAEAEADDEETIAYLKKMNAFSISEEELMVSRKQTMLYPCRNGEMHQNFRTGALTIAEGRNIAEGDCQKAVISEWLAKNNGLSVGDTFTIETKEGIFQQSDEPMNTWGEPIRLEIVGIFHANFSQQSSEFTYEDCYVENIMYIDLDTHARLEENQTNITLDLGDLQGYNRVEFFVDDPGELDNLMQQVEHWDELDLENLELTVDSGAYRASVRPYHRIRIFAMALLAVGFGGIGVILYLVMKLWVQGRQHEAGILLAVGVKKREMFGQMVMECLLVSTVALIFAFVLSGPMLDGCANAMERLHAPKTDQEGYETAIDHYKLVVTKTSSDEVRLGHNLSTATVWMTVLFVWGVSICSVYLSFGEISRLEPRKLLQSM